MWTNQQKSDEWMDGWEKNVRDKPNRWVNIHKQRYRDRCLKSKHKSIRLKKEKKQMTHLNFVTEAYPKERKIALLFCSTVHYYIEMVCFVEQQLKIIVLLTNVIPP